jgi:hypothetical protein
MILVFTLLKKMYLRNLLKDFSHSKLFEWLLNNMKLKVYGKGYRVNFNHQRVLISGNRSK